MFFPELVSPVCWVIAAAILLAAQPSAATDDISTTATAAAENIVQVDIRTDPAANLGPIDRKFFGANTLFWIDDDAALADPAYESLLRDARIGLLRFPGGEVADNYHWKTNKLDDSTFYPKRDGDKCTDTDEFIPWCRRIGAEPIFVVNLDSSAMAGNLEAGIREAADWVRYCNIEKQYNVKYWEIGNEAYLKVTRHSFTAREYAAAVTAFSRAMKAVDPSIQIGAVGPAYPDYAVPLDVVLPEHLEEARKPVHKAPRLAAVDAALSKGKKPNPDQWWPTVAKLAGSDFDFAVIHQYTPAGTYAELTAKRLHQDKRISKLRTGLKNLLGREMPLALTEWNISPDTQMSEHEQAIIATALTFDYLRAGIAMANFWPLHSPLPKKQQKATYRTMISADPPVPRPFYYYFKALSTRSGDHLVNAETDKPAVSALATSSAGGDDLTVFLLNKRTSSTVGKLSLPGKHTLVNAEAMQAKDPSSPNVSTQRIDFTAHAAGVTGELPAMSLVIMNFRRDSEAAE